MAQREAIRAVIAHVGMQGDDNPQHLEIQYEPGYDFSLEVYEFSDTVVVRVKGPDYERKGRSA
jgi:hypothetical protein